MIAALGSAIGNNKDAGAWMVPVVLGLVLALSAIVLLFWPLLRFGEIEKLPLVVALGVVSGSIAVWAAGLLQGILEPRLRFPFLADLWLSGLVEETAKLALPLLLLIAARRWFGDPRTGVLMALISGVTFGVLEGMQYIFSDGGNNQHLAMGLIRPLVESLHPLWTAIVAGAIWLTAHRSARVFTWIGLSAWLTASVLHSAHDGLFAQRADRTHTTASATDWTRSSIVETAVVVNLFSLLFVLIAMLILRHLLRELVPPTAVDANPPRWRPRLTLWGVPRATREQWAAEGSAAGPVELSARRHSSSHHSTPDHSEPGDAPSHHSAHRHQPRH